MTSRVPLPFDPGGTPFLVSAARKAGAGRSRLNGGDLQRPLWGVRSASGPTPEASAESELHSLCAALTVRMPAGAFFTHETAAQLMQLPLPRRLEKLRPPHVGVAAPTRGMDADEIIGHRVSIRPDEITSWAGFPITAPARTWLDLAARLTLVELVAVGDFLVRRDQPLCSIRDLAEAGARYPSRRGIISIRTALPLIRTRSESPRETKLRLVIVWAGLPEPESNFNIYDSEGRFLARADLAYPEYRTMIEFQGDHHRTDRGQWRRDIQRTGNVEDNGWQVLQFTDDDLATLDAQARLVERIRLRLASRGWLAPAPRV